MMSVRVSRMIIYIVLGYVIQIVMELVVFIGVILIYICVIYNSLRVILFVNLGNVLNIKFISYISKRMF